MPKSLFKLSWPRGGLVEDSPYSEQPPNATTDCLNVRNYDAIARRNRGGRRTGLSRFIDAQVNGTQPIQALAQTVEAVAINQSASVGAKFSDPSFAIAEAASFSKIAINSDGLVVRVGGNNAILTDGNVGVMLASIDPVTGWSNAVIDELTGTEIETALSDTSVDTVRALALSPDGTKVVIGADEYLLTYSISASGFTLIDTVTAFSNGDDVRSLDWSPSGQTIVAGNASTDVFAVPVDAAGNFGTAYSAPASGPSNTIIENIFFAADGTAVLAAVTNGFSTGGLDAWAFTEGSGWGSKFSAPSTGVTGWVHGAAKHPTSDAVVVLSSRGPEVAAWAFNTTTGWGAQIDTTANPLTSAAQQCVFSPSGNFVALISNDTSPSGGQDNLVVFPWSSGFGTALTLPATTPDGGYGVTWGSVTATDDIIIVTHNQTSQNGVAAYKFNVATTNPSARLTRVIAVSNGSVYRTDSPPTLYSLVNNGASAVSSTEIVRTTQAFQRLFFADGTASYKYYTLASNTVSDWRTDLTAGDLPYASDQTPVNITGVSTGSNTFTVAENLSTVLQVGDIIIVSGSTGNDGNYEVQSISGTGPTTIGTIAADPVTDATADGTLVKATEGARIITTYRGRVVLSGLRGEPQNWFMSASGDPFDFDFSPATTTSTQAVAGNNSDAGQLGDVITALAPYLDDIMIMGGANTLWVMRGDPAAGGAIDNISRNIGIAGPEAWTFDTGGNFYFFGRNGLYRMDAAASGQPLLISRNKIDNLLTNIDVANNSIRLAYDPVWQGVHIFVSPASQPTTAPTHYFWDERNDSFWPDQYPVAVGPTAVAPFLADNPEDTTILLGGFDGYVREFDDAATDDDGTAIESFVRFSPIVPGDVFATGRLDDIHIVLDNDSGDVEFSLYTGFSVEQAEDNANAGDVRYRRTLTGGRNQPFRQRVAQNAFIVELRQSDTGATKTRWAYEAGGGIQTPIDRIRGRRV